MLKVRKRILMNRGLNLVNLVLDCNLGLLNSSKKKSLIL